MQFSTKTILALSIISTSGVNGHGRLTKPGVPQVDDAIAYGDHWYSQGTLNYMIRNFLYLSRFVLLILLLCIYIFTRYAFNNQHIT